MSDNTIHTKGGDERVSAYNVVSASFDPDPNAYPGLTALKELDSQGQLRLEAAAVVVATSSATSWSRTRSVRTSSREWRAEDCSVS